MKILMIGPFPNPITGMSIANETLYMGLKDIGNEVEYINTHFYQELENKKQQGKFNSDKIIKTILRSFGECKKILFNKYDVIYITPSGTYLGFLRYAHYMICSIFKKNKMYFHIHIGVFRKMYDSKSKFGKSVLKFLLSKTSGVIVLGESLRYMFQGVIPEEKILVCENGVQDEFVATEEEINQKLDRLKKSNKKRVLYLSNLMEEKGILDLLKATEKFSEKEIEFNLAGAIEPSLERIIKTYLEKYPNKIKYHGVVKGTEKKKLLLENYIFILPSYDEGQPISILEAYTNGCAVITDESVGGIRDMFKNRINGLSCQKKDVESICDAIKNINELEYLEKNYKYGTNNFLKDNFVDRIKKILDQK